MKNTITIAGIIFFLWVSCDKINGPYKEPPPQNPPQKTVLIEKFTGHRCSGCPDASRVIDDLKENYFGNNLISVAIHPGHIAPFTAPTNTYYYDFRTPDGNTIGEDMDPDNLPQGTVNRVINVGGGRCWSKNEWYDKILELLYDENENPKLPNIEIEINNTLVNKELTISTKINVLNDLDGEYRLCLFIMEDGIIAPQLDGSETNEEYIHDHVYRCAVNGVYGESLETSLISGLEIEKEHIVVLNESNNINWIDDWNNIENCYVVGYISGPYSDNENIAQIEQTHKQQVLINE